MDRNLSGFREISHTADWALEVWAPDMEGLIGQAAQGMFSLMDIQIDPQTPFSSELNIRAEDAESLLVSCLNELCYLSESQRLGPTRFEVNVQSGQAKMKVSGGRLLAQRKEIKAVTYHRLNIQNTANGLRVVIVFDV